MTKDVYRYRFAPGVAAEDIESTLPLSVLGCEGLHGRAQVRLDAAHYFDRGQRACAIDAGTAVGSTLNRLFAGYALREFGEDGFQVERVERLPSRKEAACDAA